MPSRARTRRTGFVPPPDRPHVLGSDLVAAERRVRRRRAEAAATGQDVPPPEPRAGELRKAGRAAGLLGRRKMETVQLELDPRLVEEALWLTGARTVRELVELAALDALLRRRAAPEGGR